jgi:uncharacterized protein (TIGR03663 family)
MGRWTLPILLLLTTVAIAIRLPFLDARPMHNDEGVNAYKFGQLWPNGSYKYDPNEHHGPTLIYATYAWTALTGAPPIDRVSDSRLRMVTLLFGVALILLLPLTADALGRRGSLWAALLIGISPAFVFYSRYYIHEMLLVFFTFLALGAGWRYWRTRKLGWALLSGVALGLMHATKETFVLTLAAAIAALALNQVWNRLLDATGRPVKAPPLNLLHLAAGLGAWLGVAVLLFSSFLTNASGPWDSVRTYMPWLNRAGGDSPHVHEWSYYWQHLLWFKPSKGPVSTELLIFILALVGAGVGFIRKRLEHANASFLRFVALYTLVLGLEYSFISYKTPWCVLSFWHGAVLLAGVGAAALVGSCTQRLARVGVAAAILGFSCHLAGQAWQLAVPFACDRRNPYVYAQTSPDIKNLVNKVRAIAQASSREEQTVIKVMAPGGDFWPLPWYLFNFKNTGWWENMAPDPYAPMMLVSAAFHAALDENKTHLMVGYFQLRPEVFFELYVERGLWENHLRLNPPKREEE